MKTRSPRITALLVCATALWTAPPARADIFELKSGQRVEGTVLAKFDTHYRVHTRRGVVTVDKKSVKRHRRLKTAFDHYLKKRKRVRKTDLEGQLELAHWCEKKELHPESLVHFRRVLALDPKNTDARAAFAKRGKDPAPSTREATAPDPAEERGTPSVLFKLKTPGKTPENRRGYATHHLRKFFTNLSRPLQLVTGKGHGSEEYVVQIELDATLLRATRFYGQTVVSQTYLGQASVVIYRKDDPKKRPFVRLPKVKHEINLPGALEPAKARDIASQQTFDKIISKLSRHAFFKKRGAKPIAFTHDPD